MKEEPLSEEDLRAVQKDRQKKDNHNMSKNEAFFSTSSLSLFSFLLVLMNSVHILCTLLMHELSAASFYTVGLI